MIFRQLFDSQSSTYTYLLADSLTREAVLIDPVFEHARRDAALVEELGLKLAWTLETHVHADHVTGAWLLKRRLGSKIALCRSGGAEGADRYLDDGERVGFGAPVPLREGFPPGWAAAGGLLVGFGTRMGGGCTSGHGVCGLGRLSARSLVAVLVFMASGALATYVMRHLLGVAS